MWQNLTIEGIIPGSNMLMVTLVDEMAKAAELKSDAELKAGLCFVLFAVQIVSLQAVSTHDNSHA